MRRHVFLHEYELVWADKVHPIHPLPSRSQSEAMWARYLRSYQPPCSAHAIATDGTMSGCASQPRGAGRPMMQGRRPPQFSGRVAK
jgi:hypothetical protein